MAKTFTLTTGGYGGRHMVLECVQEPMVAGNCSDITWTLKVRGGSSNYYSTGPTQVYINGTMVYQSRRVAYTEKTFPAAKGSTGGTLRVAHDDREGTCALSLRVTTAIFTSDVITATGDWELEPIVRGSQISATDANIESPSTVVVTRRNETFTHSVAWQFGELQGYLDGNGEPVAEERIFSETTFPFLLPESFYDQIPNSAAGEGTLTCRTYSGETLVGTHSCSFLVTAAQSRCAPVLEAALEVEDALSHALTGNEETLIRFVSNARIFVTARGQKGATVARRQVQGVALTEEYLDIPQAELDRYSVSVTDSRGYCVTGEVRANMVPYVLPTANITLARTDPASGNARLTLRGVCYKGSFGAEENTLQAVCRIEDREILLEPSWQEDGSYSIDTRIEGLNYTQAVTVQVTVSDKVTSVTKAASVQPGIPVFDWGQEDFAFHVPVTAPSFNGVDPAGLLQYRGSCGDADAAVETGLYQLVDTSVNVPNQNGILLVLEANGRVLQLAVDFSARERWIRTVWYDTPWPWQEW